MKETCKQKHLGILLDFQEHWKSLLYRDIIFDQAFNSSFHQKIEPLQYNAALAITGAISGTPREKIYQELGLESLQQRRWYRKLCLFFKIYKKQCLKCLSDIIPQSNCQYRTRIAHNIPHIIMKHQFFKNSFFINHNRMEQMRF